MKSIFIVFVSKYTIVHAFSSCTAFVLIYAKYVSVDFKSNHISLMLSSLVTSTVL